MPTTKSTGSKNTVKTSSQQEELKRFDSASTRLLNKVKHDKVAAKKFFEAIGYFDIMPPKARKAARAKLATKPQGKSRQTKKGK